MQIRLNKIYLFLLMGVILMLSYSSSYSDLAYEEYSSKDPELNIIMDYPAGWFYRENRGAYGSFVHVAFHGSTSKDKDMGAVIAITLQDEAKVEFRPATLEAMAEDLLAKRLNLKDAKILSRYPVKFIHTEAANLELSYKIPKELNSLNADLIPSRERILIFKLGNKFYTLRYQNNEAEFDKYKENFEQCISTLKFKDTKQFILEK